MDILKVILCALLLVEGIIILKTKKMDSKGDQYTPESYEKGCKFSGIVSIVSAALSFVILLLNGRGMVPDNIFSYLFYGIIFAGIIIGYILPYHVIMKKK